MSHDQCLFEHIHNSTLQAEQRAETIKMTTALFDKRYPSATQILRDVHAKSHGCIKAH